MGRTASKNDKLNANLVPEIISWLDNHGKSRTIALNNNLVLLHEMEIDARKELSGIFIKQELDFIKNIIENISYYYKFQDGLIDTASKACDFRDRLIEDARSELKLGSATNGLIQGKAILSYFVTDKSHHQELSDKYHINVFELIFKLLSLTAFQAYRLVFGLLFEKEDSTQFSFINLAAKEPIRGKRVYKVNEEEPCTVQKPEYKDLLFRSIEMFYE